MCLKFDIKKHTVLFQFTIFCSKEPQSITHIPYPNDVKDKSLQAISEWKNWNGMYNKLRLHLVLFRVGKSPSYIYVSLWQKYINLDSIKIEYIHPNSFYHYPCPPLRAIKMLAVERGVRKYFKLLWWTLFVLLVTAIF